VGKGGPFYSDGGGIADADFYQLTAAERARFLDRISAMSADTSLEYAGQNLRAVRLFLTSVGALLFLASLAVCTDAWLAVFQ
jgi:hypothetical protein